MPRFFAELIDGDHAVITGSDARHICGPLRKKQGDELCIRDLNTGYAARIVSADPKKVTLEIVGTQELHERGTPQVHLGMSMIDLKDMDQLIRTVTELGVADIYPLIAERSNIRTLTETRLDRWNIIIAEAVKQCERRDIPVIHHPAGLMEFIRSSPVSWKVRLVASQEATRTIHDCRADDVGILIGPEGGFTRGELDAMAARGFIPVSMGRTILRSITAAMTAVSILGM